MMDSPGPTMVASLCLTLGLTIDETNAVEASLRFKRFQQTAADAYRDLAEAVHAVKPSALPSPTERTTILFVGETLEVTEAQDRMLQRLADKGLL